MCDRYSLKEAPDVLKSHFQFNTFLNIQPLYNIAPTQLAPIVTKDKTDRKLSMLKWGFFSREQTNPSSKNYLINLRAETLLENHSLRKTFPNRRCLVLADGFYEWKKEYNKKQPYRIHFANNNVFAFAGILDEGSLTNFNQRKQNKFVIITTEALTSISHIHKRMPVILKRENYASWLDDDPKLAFLALKSCAGFGLRSYKVSPMLGNTEHDSPDLLNKYSDTQLSLF